jgi:coenzyme PQQ precursor peptide PqqA
VSLLRLPDAWLTLSLRPSGRPAYREETTMAWTTPTLVEICIGLEINGYLPAEF